MPDVPTSAVCEVVVTGDPEVLEALARELVEQRLVACGQHIERIRSVYRWKGAVVSEVEGRLAMHTRTSLAQAVSDFVSERHPYEVPCVLTLPVTHVNPSYEAWVLESTRDGHLR